MASKPPRDPNKQRVSEMLAEVFSPVQNSDTLFGCGCGLIFFSVPVTTIAAMYLKTGFFESFGTALGLAFLVGFGWIFVGMAVENIAAKWAARRFRSKFPVNGPDRELAISLIKTRRKEGTGIKALMQELGIAEDMKNGPNAPAEEVLAEGLNSLGNDQIPSENRHEVGKTSSRKEKDKIPVRPEDISPKELKDTHTGELSRADSPTRPPFIPLEPFPEDKPIKKTDWRKKTDE